MVLLQSLIFLLFLCFFHGLLTLHFFLGTQVEHLVRYLNIKIILELANIVDHKLVRHIFP